MNRFFSLFLVLFAWTLQLPAQAPVYRVIVSGSVKDADGNPVAGQAIRIIADSTAGFSYAAAVISDRKGLFADTLSVPQTVGQGILSLYTGDCKGNLLRQDVKFAASHTRAEAHFVVCTRERDFCEAYIQPDSSGILYVKASGREPFSYRWNTGSTGARLRPSAAGAYCVTVTDASGCVTSTCYFWAENGDVRCKAYIQYLDRTPEGGLVLYAGAGGVEPYTYAWSSGSTGKLDTALTSGTYCVTVTDARGCRSFACESVYVAPCGIRLQLSPDSTMVEARVFGQAPFTYDWHNGATGSSVPLKEPGAYCVAVTDANGCVSKECFYWNEGPRDSFLCKVYIRAEETADGVKLSAGSSGKGPYIYQWTNGETESSIFARERGEYCVAVTDASGCISKACYIYRGKDTVDTGLSYVIAGFVLDCERLTESKLYGEIQLLREEGDGSFTIVDSTVYGPGFYAARYGFFRVPKGRYLLRAIPAEGAPVYFPGVSDRKEATVIEAPYLGDRLFPICLNGNAPAPEKPGLSKGHTPKQLSPTTLDLAPNPAHETIRLTFGEEPRPGAVLQLVNMTGQVLRSWRPLDQTMELDLFNIPSGMYWFRFLNSGAVASARFIKE